MLNIRPTLELADLQLVLDTLKRKYRDQPVVSRDDFSTLLAVYGLMIDLGQPSINNVVYLPNALSVLLPARLLYMNPLDHTVADRPEDYVHPAVDRRICAIAGCQVRRQAAAPNNTNTLLTTTTTNGASFDGLPSPLIMSSTSSASSAAAPVIMNGGGKTNGHHNHHHVDVISNGAAAAASSSSRVFPRVFGNKRLEGILARLDDDKIDANLVINIDEGNPQLILDYLIEANKCHSLSAFLSEDDIFVILKYFNDFLARNYSAGTFHRFDLSLFIFIFIDSHFKC